MEKEVGYQKEASFSDFNSSDPQAHIHRRMLHASASDLFKYKSKGKGSHKSRCSI